MPRQPTDFEIGTVYIDVEDRIAPVSISATEYVPRKFWARFQLVRPKLEVVALIWIASPGNRPTIRQLTMVANENTPVTTTVLRRVLVDQLIKEAVKAAAMPTRVVTGLDVAGHAYEAHGGIWVGPAPQPLSGRGRDTANGNAEAAARIYSAATASGSRAPGMEVKAQMHISRSTATRHIRRARELGLLGPPEAEGQAQDAP